MSSHKKNTIKKNKFSLKNIFNHHLSLSIFVFFLFSSVLLFLFNHQPKVTQVLGASNKLSQEKIIQLINLERAKKGIGPIVANQQLNAAAEKKGSYMFSLDYWAHIAPDGTPPWLFIHESGYHYQSAGENLARDFQTEEELIAAWMASPTHRANLLNASFNEAGVAILDGIIDNQPIILIVNFFGQPKNNSGVLKQVAIYDQQADAMVLAGEVMPQGTLLKQKKIKLNTNHILFGFFVLGFVLFIYKTLQQKPYKRKRKKN